MIIEAILMVIVPFCILKFRKTTVVSTVGTAGFAYLLGMIYSLIVGDRNTVIAEDFAYLGIALGIPLLLFSNNLKDVMKLSKEVLKSFGLLIVSVILVSMGVFFVYGNAVPNGDILSGMAVGLYTGGTPNLNAVACIFNLDTDTILASNISDIIFGGLFYAFLIFLSKPIVSKILGNSQGGQYEIDGELYFEDIKEDFKFSKGLVRNMGLSVLSVGVSAGIGAMTNQLVPALMIGTTVFGLALSSIEKVRTVKGNNIIGQYFATLFSFAIASLINFETLSNVSMSIFIIFASITTLSFIVHIIACKIFKIKADVMIVTSTSGIFGPAFIPSVARAIGADYLVASGLITGSLGYAIGTALGVAFVYVI